MTPAVARTFALLCTLALTACIGGGGGGGGGQASGTGGPEGAQCDPAFYGEGCFKNTRMACDATAKAWKLIADCGANATCVEKNQVGSPKRTTVCEATAVVVVDAGPTSADTAVGEGGGLDGPITTKADTGADAPSDVAPGDVPRGPVCGNGVCEAGESAATCPVDCKGPSTVCGNGVCEAGETGSSCPGDCGGGGSGDCSGAADSGKINSQGYSAIFSTVVSQCVLGGSCFGKPSAEMSSCVSQCLVKNGTFSAECSKCIGAFSACAVEKCLSTCGSTPNSAQCQSCTMAACGAILKDCGAPDPTPAAVCGNGVCESGESKSSCPKDCGSAAVCGNGVCESGETSTNCAKDCAAPAKCGDFVCAPSESVATCPTDCDPVTKCVMSKCPAETSACGSDAKCAALVQCLSACSQSDTQCIQGCAGSAGNTAVGLYQAMATCAQKVGCAGGSAQCGNGTCDAGETSSSCPADCKSGGGHVCDSACGGQAPSGKCYCDSECKSANDCCNADGSAQAGSSCAGSTCGDCK